MEEEFIKKIRDNYGINEQLKKIKTIPGYPHIKILSFDKDYIVKNVNKIYCKDIDTLYNYLSKSSYVELPIKTIDDKYGLSINGKTFVTYPFLQEIGGRIQSYWWAFALESIHNIDISKDDFNTDYTIDKECFSLLSKANYLISDEVKKGIECLLDNYYYDTKIENLVLSHGDPYDSNVMNNRTNIRLIDSDGSRLLPEEFDIGRLFYNEVNRESSFNEIDKYINVFFYNYRNSIDMNLLKRMYVIDLVRTFSWLNLVTKDKKREDLSRQIEELEKYKESILTERHNKVLKKL